MKTGRGSFIEISTAEAGTIQLEFRDLARSSKQPKFEVNIGLGCFYVLLLLVHK